MNVSVQLPLEFSMGGCLHKRFLMLYK